ncbi:class I SAM-dependent methyltransferase [Desulfovibrio sp.]
MADDSKVANRELRIGVDYFDKVANRYMGQLQSEYHRHRLGVIESLLHGLDLKGKTCVDFGCGDGIFCETLAERGAFVIGIDPSEIMIEKALQQYGQDKRMRFILGGSSDFMNLRETDVFLVTALNVLAYQTAEEEKQFYEAGYKALQDGGWLILTHSNELFDMYTFNKYTVRFFKNHFGGGSPEYDISSLLLHPEKPERGVLSIRENPLNYKFKLRGHGFEEVRQEFMMLHKVPPLMQAGFDCDDLNSREFPDTLNWRDEDAWKLMFQCSVFASKSRKRTPPPSR